MPALIFFFRLILPVSYNFEKTDMRIVLSIILLYASLEGYAQVSDDSLKKIFTAQYLNGLSEDEDLRSFFGPRKPVFSSMQELFGGCFGNTRIYMVLFIDNVRRHPHEPDYWPQLYAVDIVSGKPVLFESDNTFRDFINSTRKPIANLDKAYLYVALYMNAYKGSCLFFIAKPYQYPPEVRMNNTFDGDGLEVFFYHPGGYYVTREPGLATSTTKRIVMTSPAESMHSVTREHRHQFYFDKSDKMTRIMTDTVSLEHSKDIWRIQSPTLK